MKLSFVCVPKYNVCIQIIKHIETQTYVFVKIS